MSAKMIRRCGLVLLIALGFALLPASPASALPLEPAGLFSNSLQWIDLAFVWLGLKEGHSLDPNGAPSSATAQGDAPAPPDPGPSN